MLSEDKTSKASVKQKHELPIAAIKTEWEISGKDLINIICTSYKSFRLVVTEDRIFFCIWPIRNLKLPLAAMLFDWSDQNEFFVEELPCINHLVPIGPVVSEEKIFEDGQSESRISYNSRVFHPIRTKLGNTVLLAFHASFLQSLVTINQVVSDEMKLWNVNNE